MPGNSTTISSVQIACFSGTGGAMRVALAFEKNLGNKGIETRLTALEGPALRQPLSETGGLAQPDLLLLVFAVHAFDAPMPVYTWLGKQENTSDRAVVISVSGGGETFPNTGCRSHVCAALEAKGYTVVHDAMMVMPCNWTVQVPDTVAMWLLNSLPEKCAKILDSVLAGNIHRTRHKLGPVRAKLTVLEKKHAYTFAKGIRTGENCTGCGWCAASCPMENIRMDFGKPSFGENCVMCFRCVYGCPSHALHSKNFMVLKGGFDLAALERRMQGVPLSPVEKCCKGWAWKGVRKYLLDQD